MFYRVKTPKIVVMCYVAMLCDIYYDLTFVYAASEDGSSCRNI